MPRRCTFIPLGAVLLSLVFSAAAQAEVEQPGTGWEVSSTTFPTHIAPGGGSGFLELDVFNIGAEQSRGTITVTDVLPPGVLATEAGDVQSTRPTGGLDLWECKGNAPGESPRKDTRFEPASVVTCTNNTALLPTLPIPEENESPSQNDNGAIAHIGLAVKAMTAEPGTLSNHVTVAGGDALAPASTSSPVTVSSESAPSFGFLGSDGWFGSANGTVDTQAGSHPYDFTYSFDVNTASTETGLSPTGSIRNLAVKLPPGLIGNPTAVPQCTRQQFDKEECSPSTQVGVASVGNSLNSSYFHRPYNLPLEVYNIVPPPGVPARFGFILFGVQTFIDATVRSGGDYGITAHANDIVQKAEGGQQFEIINTRMTLWGEPSDPAHDDERYSVTCQSGCPSSAPRLPFLTLPTACPSEPQPISATVDTWEPGGSGETSTLFHTAGDIPSNFTGCDHLGFAPSISVAPDTSDSDTPAGLTVDVHVPQEGLTTPGALATSNIKDTTVALPAGVVINPGQAAGLQSCPEGRPSHEPGNEHYGDALTTQEEKSKGEEDTEAAYCPNASKVGTVEAETPILFKPLKGEVYVLQSNPPHLKLLASFSGEGVNVKLLLDAGLCEKAGEELDGKTCETAGQIISRVENIPEAPVSDFELSFSGGAQAALATAVDCGTYTASSDFTPWSTPQIGDVFPTSDFQVTSGPGGSPCPSGTLPFNPSLTAGSTTDQAGGFTNFSLLLQSGDGRQRIDGLQFRAPEGLTGELAKVPLCTNAQAETNTCPESSKIGHTVVESGPGPYPLVVPEAGQPPAAIYLTESYDGAPFGLAIVVPLHVGPFTLETQRVRAKIEIDPYTAALTVTTDPLPQVVDGVPTDLREVDAVIERPEFMINPTNCDPQEFSGTAFGTPPPGAGGPGANASISSHFQVGACKALEFAPKFSVSTSGRTSKADGASLTAIVSYPSVPQGTDADIALTKVELPKQLPSRLTTLQKACTAAQFDANPAGCPAASFIGHATVHTPLLPVALTGPAIFVSHGGEAFPSLEVVLQGDGVTIDLVGTTYISPKGITSTTFKTIPDAPFSTFELTLPEGKYSALAANGNLCAPTTTTTVKKKVTLKTKSHTKTLIRKVKETTPVSLAMPNEFIAQNGAAIKQTTKIAVTGCAKAKPARKTKTNRKKSNANRRKSKKR